MLVFQDPPRTSWEILYTWIKPFTLASEAMTASQTSGLSSDDSWLMAATHWASQSDTARLVMSR